MLKARESSIREMTFWEHLEELAKSIKVALYVLIVSLVAMLVFPANLSFLENPFEFYDPLIAVILRSIKKQVLPPNVQLIGLEFVAPIELYLIASFFCALAITAPVFAFEIYKFIDPALHPNERKDVYPFITSFLILFAIGLIFGYVILVPFALLALLPFFSIVGAEMIISVTEFYYFVFFLTLMTGFACTFPVFLVLLVKHRIIETGLLTRNRKYVYIGILILVFIITPGEGGLANFMLFALLVALLEAGIFFAHRYEKKGGHEISDTS